MARPKKNGTYLNVCIETPIYERLERFCEAAGQTKTVAVERALAAYLNDYDIKNLNVHLSIANLICHGIAETEEEVEALKAQEK